MDPAKKFRHFFKFRILSVRPLLPTPLVIAPWWLEITQSPGSNTIEYLTLMTALCSGMLPVSDRLWV